MAFAFLVGAPALAAGQTGSAPAAPTAPVESPQDAAASAEPASDIVVLGTRRTDRTLTN